ncbi:flagellar biosynthesis protein FlgM, partial [Streptomyces sp. SID10815]|nr:flagellar biosynthesis protein FlgM [Streptomyces sp. SID10815]
MAVAVVATTAVTCLAGQALAAPAAGPNRTASSAGSTALVVTAARAAAFAHASATGVTQGDELRPEDVMLDPEGARHVRFV